MIKQILTFYDSSNFVFFKFQEEKKIGLHKLFFRFFFVFLFHSISHIPTLIPRILTVIPHVPTVIPRVPIIPLIPFSDSPFRLLKIAHSKDLLRDHQIFLIVNDCKFRRLYKDSQRNFKDLWFVYHIKVRVKRL